MASKGCHGLAGQPFGDCGARAEPVICCAMTDQNAQVFGAAAHSSPGNRRRGGTPVVPATYFAGGQRGQDANDDAAASGAGKTPFHSRE